MGVGVKIGLFGTMSVLIDGEPMPKVRSRKAKWLLAILALRDGKPISRSCVAGMLWPDADAATALTNLRAVISDLRQALRGQAGRLLTPDRRTLAFDFSDAAIDLASYNVALLKGNLEEAVALYSAPLLQDCDEEWIGPERGAREQECLAALRELAKRAEPGKAVEWAQRAVVVAPWQDGARRDLMSAYVRAGDHTAAVTAYRDFARAVRAETGRVPDAQTTELYNRIRSGQHSVEAGEAPKPLVTSSFIGREDERIELADEIRSRRLVTLSGEGGIGKTRLAQEVADDLRREFSDGVCFVALEAVQGEESLLYAIATSLPIKQSTKLSPLEGLVESLRAKHLLLILDNCEHLLPACVRLANRLLAECPHLRILATSREPLGLVGESVWMVPGLTTPDPEHLPEQSATLLRVLGGYESVRLFVERAQATARHFEITRDNAASVAELCAILEGSPLAIELAAGRVRTMGVPDILARFREDRLNFLTAPRRSQASRHQNLRRTLDWSYSLLAADERRMFARLAIFAGGWTLEAAETVVDISPPLLESLVEKSLVKFSPNGRYGFLETVRQYASERLAESGEARRLGAKHSEYYAAFTERLAADQTPKDALDREMGNFNAALDREGGDPETSLRLATGLYPHWERTFSLDEGTRRIGNALHRYPSQISALRALALNQLAVLRLKNDIQAAIALFEESLGMRRELGDAKAMAQSLYGLGRAWFYAADYVRAAAIVDECISRALEADDKKLLAAGKGLRCYLCLLAGDYRRAKTLGTESLCLLREARDPKNIAAMLRTLGTLAYELGDYDLYRQHNEEAFALNRSLGYLDRAAWCLIDLGRAATDLGQVAMGRELIEEALETTRKLDDRFGTASALEGLGYSHLAQGNTEQCRRLFEDSLSAFRALEDRNGMARIMDGLGDAASGEEADAYYREALVVWRELNCLKRIRDGLLRIGNGMANSDRSIRLWAYSYRMGETMGTPIPLPMRARHEQAIRAARCEPSFAASWAEGEAMSLEAALALVP